MTNEAKLNFIKNFNIIGEDGKNDIQNDLQTGSYGTCRETFDECWDEVGEFLNPDDIAVYVLRDFVSDGHEDEYDKLAEKLAVESEDICTPIYGGITVRRHPIVGIYMDADDLGNPGLIFTFTKE